MRELRGATAIVTGASRGIGVYIARALAAEGVQLALAARSQNELEAVRAEVVGMGVKAIAVRCDVGDAAQRAELIERTEAELGPVDVLVNNAGIEVAGRYETFPEGELSRIIDINLTVPMLLTRAVLPGMLARGRGHVVNIASGAGKAGVPYEAAYAASKHGLVGMTHSLRAEFLGHPVGFSAICPGFVSDAGMYARWEERGRGAPRIVGRATPEKVASVTVRAIKRNSAEVLVNTPPLRPIVVLGNMVPAVQPWIMKLFGYTRTFRGVAEIEEQERSAG